MKGPKTIRLRKRMNYLKMKNKIGELLHITAKND